MIVIETHTVPPDTEKIRFREYARKAFPVITSAKGIRKAIKENRFLLDGKPAQTGSWVMPGQRIELLEKEGTPPPAYMMKLEVIFEDDHLAVINKPAGIPVNGNRFRTVEHALPSNLKKTELDDAIMCPRPVHRLDSQTSGILIIAKTYSALRNISSQFENSAVKKKYRAVVQGKIDGPGRIDSPLDGRECISLYRPLACVRSLRNGWLTLAELEPLTGRTHQLRRHMAGIGCPVVGDRLYGAEGDILKGKGLFLASVEAEFTHPSGGERLRFSVEEPGKFSSLLKREERRWEKFRDSDPEQSV